jgi:glycosyltransferase involved in cell wall biosynthesis
MNNNKSAEKIEEGSTTLSGKTILVIDACLPQYDKDSGSNRMLHLLRMFKRLGYQVIFFPDNGKANEPYFTLLKELSIEVIYRPGRSGTWKNALKQCLTRVDICWLSRPDLNEKYSYIFDINPKIKWIYDSLDLHYVRLGREAKLLEDAHKRMKVQKQANTFEKLEISLAKRADVTIAITATEEEELNRRGARNVKVVPNIHVSQAGSNTFAKREGIMFIGGFAHLPNVDAVIWLVNEIMPVVWQALPGTKVYLVGSNPPPEVAALANELVIVTGYINDVSSYFNNSRLFVAPLRYGAGMKGKIGQALEYALPIVSTTIGTEGMNLQDGIHVLEANTVGALQQSIMDLYTNEELWEKLQGNSRSALKPLLYDHQEENVKEILSSLFKPYKLTIITVVQNAEATLQDLIDSVATYKTPEVEFLVWDGQSTDRTLQILEQNSKVVDHYVSLSDSGIYDAVNKAIQLANGEFYLFMGADDLLSEGFRQMLPILKDDKTIYYGGVYMDSTRVSKPYSAYRLTKEHICHQGIIYPRAVFEKYTYDTKYQVFADYLLNLQCWTDPDFKQHYEDLIIAKFSAGGFSDIHQDVNFARDKEALFKQLLNPWDYLRYLRRKLGYGGLLSEVLGGLKPYTLPKKDSARLSIMFVNEDFSTNHQAINPHRTYEMIEMLCRMDYEVIFLTPYPYFQNLQLEHLQSLGVKFVEASISPRSLEPFLNQVEIIWFLGYQNNRRVLKSIKRKRHIKSIFDVSGLPAPEEKTLVLAKQSHVTITETPEWEAQLTSRNLFHIYRPDMAALKMMFNHLR